MAENLIVVTSARGHLLLKPNGKTLVLTGTGLLWHRVVGRVPRQNVTKGKGVVVDEVRTLRANQLLAHQRHQSSAHRRAVGTEINECLAPEIFPMTEALSMISRSSLGSCSRRAASSACIDGGTDTLERSPDITQPPSVRCSKPSSRSIVVISSANRGFPSAEAAMRAFAAGSRETPPRMLAMTFSHSVCVSGSSKIDVALSFPPAQPGLLSRSSGRDMHSNRSGASCVQSATYSINSSSVGSAHCRSSITTMRGLFRASISNSLRTAHALSSDEVVTSRIPQACARS